MKFNFKMTDEEALEFLENKGHKISFNYDELQHDAHKKMFTVAKTMKNDLLHDIHQSIINAMKDGKPFEQWKKELKGDLAKYGWLGKKDITDPRTGEVKSVNINARRLQTIYRTNMNNAIAVSRYKGMMELDNAVYWEYIALEDSNTRQSHALLNGQVRHRDDPFWDTNYPPNGWGCRCRVRAITKQEAERNGLTILDKGTPPPKGYEPHKDWAYNVGNTEKVGKLSKIDISADNNSDIINKDESLRNLSDDELKDKFYQQLGINKGDTFIDVIGDPIIIDDSLFQTGAGASKIKKFDRHLYLNEFAKTISDPDEVFLEWQELRNPSNKYVKHTHRLVKKMFKHYVDEKGKNKAIMVVFEYQKDKTQGATLFNYTQKKDIEKQRTGKLIYKK